MITLTKTTFDQALTGNALVFFHRLKGCANCDRMLPHVQSFEKEGVVVFDVDVDADKELTGTYGPMREWQLPLVVYFENGKAVNTQTGVFNIEDITKTLDNISDIELESLFLDATIDHAQKKKALFASATQLERIGMARQKRIDFVPSAEQIIPPTAGLQSIKLGEEDFPLGESTAEEPEVCESCQ